MGTILETIVGTKRAELEAARHARPLASVQAAAMAVDPPRDFYRAVVGGSGELRLIAEIKKASPSAGLIRKDFQPVEIAKIYEQCGAAALSVLTDRVYFSGDLSFLERIRNAVALPLLRKDFIIDEYQVFESRAAGADAILLIAEILTIEQMRAMSDISAGLGMSTLIEVHDAPQRDAVLPLIAPQRKTILGINNRNLHIQQTDLQTTHTLAAGLNPETPFVSESGIRTREDVISLHKAGAAALLIGETFMREPDIGAKVRELMGA